MIAPDTHARQRLAVVERPGEKKCSGCGCRTRDQTGTCATCRRAGARDLKRMTTPDLLALVAAAKVELTRRRDAIDAALSSADGGGEG